MCSYLVDGGAIHLKKNMVVKLDDFWPVFRVRNLKHLKPTPSDSHVIVLVTVVKRVLGIV